MPANQGVSDKEGLSATSPHKTPFAETEVPIGVQRDRQDASAVRLLVADEFTAVRSNSDRVQANRSRMAEFDRSKDAGVTPTPLLWAQMFGDAVLMVSEHKPDRGKPLHVTRVWLKRGRRLGGGAGLSDGGD